MEACHDAEAGAVEFATTKNCMNPKVAKRLRLAAGVVSCVLLVAVLAVGWYYWRVRASLPQLDGSAAVAGLGAAVTVDRDAIGVPTIRGGNRADVARALGWLHAQERFFQMDVLRRVAAGELAEAFGKRAVPRDRAARMHGFRALATKVVARLVPAERALLDAYVAGVNSGLAALGERPFEYLVLRDRPAPWRPEDTILVIYAMTLDLQDGNAGYELSLMTLRDKLGHDALAFFAPIVTPGDAALDGSTALQAPVPAPKMLDLRTKKMAGGFNARPGFGSSHPASFPFAPRDPEFGQGSNAFAVAGAHTASGVALLANDMHLDHGVPNTWYRASFEFAGKKITGVTLPGTPAMVAGSNGSVAWGFTASYVDTGDLVEVEVNATAKSLYKSPDRDEFLKIEERRETIAVKGGDPVVADYPWTIWGPIVATSELKRPLAYRWIAHDPEATNLALIEMESATTVAEAIAVAHRAGMPAQNIMLADKAGAIAWTIAGRLPKRIGYDGRLPVTWNFGDRKWDGYLAPGEVPVVHGDAASQPGRLWSANHRHVGGEALAKLGDGAYRRAPRAAQIRDDLAALRGATPKDLLGVQLDDRALFLAPWHRLLLDTLKPEVVAEKKARGNLKSFAEKWEGRASIDAVSYRLVREFRTAVHARVFPPIFASCKEAYPEFDSRNLQLEGAGWAMLKEKPPHLLNPAFASWEELLVAAADDTIRAIDKSGVALTQANWGWRNRARIRHPLSNSFPFLAQWLDMPADPLPGDSDMPRVQSPTHGASERMVVSPGREHEGIFHMPCGQSAHPMSPYFRAGHEAWVRGEATPFLPGKTAHTLTLKP
jgi:penicillin G amidase